MQSIHSPPSMEKIIRALLPMIFVDVFSIWFLYDGYIGYPTQNRMALAQSLGMVASSLPSIDPTLTAAEAEKIIAQIKQGDDDGAAIGKVGRAVLRHGDDAYVPGPGGHLKIATRGGKVTDVRWEHGTHRETDILLQQWLGYCLVVVGIALTVRFVRVGTSRTSLTDTGLRVSGQPVIPFEAMTGLYQANRNGSAVELHHTLNGGKGRVKLDPYDIRDLKVILATICEKKGFVKPL